MHLYVELWNARPAWLALSMEERKRYFDLVGSEIGKLLATGIEIVGFGVNDRETPHSSGFRYFAVWKMPGLEQVKLLESAVEQAGWHKYFEQVNARGELVAPEAALADMLGLSRGAGS